MIQLLCFYQLELNDLALTLGSASTDLTVTSIVTLDNANEWLNTADADLILLADLNISGGGLTSTGGIISLPVGGHLSGTGTMELRGSSLVLDGDFVKSSGTLISSQTDLTILSNITLTSDSPEALSL